ncbi:MAG: hypothetical protein R3E79_35955 [Caldilineaceae bacterium]
MLDATELKQVRDYVIKILPELLRSEPEIATTIEGILAEHFPRRDEFARLLDEVQQSRYEMNQRFEQVDKRFEQVDKRFEQVDKRFEQVDRRFEQVDRRFEQVERTMLGMRRDIVKLQSGQESIIRRMDNMEAWFGFVTGNLRNEKGRSLEDAIAMALRHGLKNPTITADQIRQRVKLVDENGVAFLPGYETEVDLVAQNGELLVYEVKSTAKASEVSFFALKLNVIRSQNPDKVVRGVFITMVATEEVQQACIRYNIELVDSAQPAQPVV